MTEINDTIITLRFRLGMHAIFLFVDTLKPFSAVTPELLELLRERYPDGMKASLNPPKTVPVPAGSDADIAYATMVQVSNESAAEWKRIESRLMETTPEALGLKNNDILAFAFVEDQDDEVDFEVEFPQDENDQYGA
ncbi:hypothetical protein B0T10DRAFT_490262 [Thelonectria olida]|uniref:Uncharacterized protein n=1 Tax=Thelonectria olida TaxID=1576542 RepID=A0A9P9ANA9_9HYPO|nr:hypothetical protein B0T10DRAFT_490262 [Thelonectria olida]